MVAEAQCVHVRLGQDKLGKVMNRGSCVTVRKIRAEQCLLLAGARTYLRLPMRPGFNHYLLLGRASANQNLILAEDRANH